MLRLRTYLIAALVALAIIPAAAPAAGTLRGTVKIVQDGRPANGGDIGKFAMTGALSDAGTLVTKFRSASGNVVHLQRTLLGKHGRIVFKLDIKTNGTNVGPISGVWTIVSGTGRYAGLHGQGTSKGFLKANNGGYHEVATGRISR